MLQLQQFFEIVKYVLFNLGRVKFSLSAFPSVVFLHLSLSLASRTALRTLRGERLGGSNEVGEINDCGDTSFPLSALNDI